jgi:hypothetical protein
MKEVANIRPYWRYRHSPASVDARPEHLAWDGVILKHDDPWWASHSPPGGFGCKCYVETLAERDMKKQGLAVADKDKIPFKDRGVDKGWDYQPGASVVADLARLEKLKEDKLRRMSDNNSDFLEGRSRPRGELPKQTKPTEPGTIPVDQLSKLEGDAKAYVVGQGKKDGNEHLSAFDLQTGTLLARATSHKPDRVSIPAELTKQALDPNQQIAYHHNHPESFSLSLVDLELLDLRPGLASVTAHGHDGSRYQASRGDMKNFTADINAVDSEMLKQVDLAQRRGMSITGVDAHLVNLALAAEGVIQYQYTLSPALSAHFEKDRAAYERIVDELRYAIKRAR